MAKYFMIVFLCSIFTHEIISADKGKSTDSRELRLFRNASISLEGAAAASSRHTATDHRPPGPAPLFAGEADRLTEKIRQTQESCATQAARLAREIRERYEGLDARINGRLIEISRRTEDNARATHERINQLEAGIADLSSQVTRNRREMLELVAKVDTKVKALIEQGPRSTSVAQRGSIQGSDLSTRLVALELFTEERAIHFETELQLLRQADQESVTRVVTQIRTDQARDTEIEKLKKQVAELTCDPSKLLGLREQVSQQNLSLALLAQRIKCLEDRAHLADTNFYQIAAIRNEFEKRVAFLETQCEGQTYTVMNDIRLDFIWTSKLPSDWASIDDTPTIDLFDIRRAPHTLFNRYKIQTPEIEGEKS